MPKRSGSSSPTARPRRAQITTGTRFRSWSDERRITDQSGAHPRAERQLRCKAIGGRVVITAGIQALGTAGVCQVLAAVAQFDNFTEDNDPWGEHDCAVLDVEGRRVIFKVDYCDRSLTAH